MEIEKTTRLSEAGEVVMLRFGDVHSGVVRAISYEDEGESFYDIEMKDGNTYTGVPQQFIQFNGKCTINSVVMPKPEDIVIISSIDDAPKLEDTDEKVVKTRKKRAKSKSKKSADEE